jgi:hypothetical protein
MKLIFLDTNILIKFIPIFEINWKIIFKDNVELIIAPAIIFELDMLKSDKNEKVRTKAQKAIKLFSEIVEKGKSNVIENNTKMIFLNDEAPNEIFVQNKLNPIWIDDRILASIIDFLKTNDDVSLLSDDAGIRFKAKQNFNIKTLELPEQYKYNIVDDEKVNKIKTLQKEIKDLKNKEPKLNLKFENKNETLVFNIDRFIENHKEYVESNLASVKNKYPFVEYVSEEKKKQIDANSSLLDIIMQTKISTLMKLSKKDVDEDNGKIKEYIRDYEEYLHNLYQYRKVQKNVFEINFIVTNAGNVPTDDVRIHFHFPDGFDVLHEYELEHMPSEPIAPLLKSRFNLFDSIKNFNTISPIIHNLPANYNPPPSNVSGFNIKKTKSFDITCKIRRLMHTHSVELDSLYLKFDDYDSIKSFEFEYDFIAENLSNKTRGKLNIVFNKM